MPLWEDAITTAVVGTARQGVSLPDRDPLAESLSGLGEREPEALLLGAAAAAALYRRAGQRPVRDTEPLPAPAGAEEQPACAPPAARHLERLLAGEHQPVLPEWLRAAAGRGLRVPESLLPELLQAGRAHRDLRPLILPVLGKRGRWLSAQNRDWDYLAADDEEEASWETGTRAGRRMLLARIREADPARAREMLVATWAKEPAEDRAAFLAVLRDRLSMEDEPFLEAALDDRSKAVRQTASDLLARLPHSRLSARMRRRVGPLITVEPASAAIRVTLPEACDPEMVRDGVEPKVPAHERRWGEKAWWLVQMAAAVPPAEWSAEVGAAPAALIRALDPAWRDALIEAWSIAAERHGDAEWAHALLAAGAVPANRQEALVRVLPPERREEVALGLLQGSEQPLHGEHPAVPVLAACEHPWSDPFSRAVVAALARRIASSSFQTSYDWTLYTLVPELALRIDPELAAEIRDAWPAGSPRWADWAPVIERFTATLEFRAAMLAALMEEIRR